MTESQQRELPKRIAKEVALPDGASVWMRTVNAHDRREAIEAADLAAARAMKRYRPGGDAFEDKLAEFADQMPADQAAFLAARSLGAAAEDAWSTHPDPPELEREESEGDDTFGARSDAWEKTRDGARQARQRHIEAKEKAALEIALAMSDGDRAVACYKAWREAKHQILFQERFEAELIARGARRSESDSERAYSDAEAVLALDDAVREALVKGYFAADTVTPAQVPTSPGA